MPELQIAGVDQVTEIRNKNQKLIDKTSKKKLNDREPRYKIIKVRKNTLITLNIRLI